MEEYFEQTKIKWQKVKEELLGEEVKYTSLKEDIVGYMKKKEDLKGWIRKAEELCGQMKDIENCDKIEDIFHTFEVCN